MRSADSPHLILSQSNQFDSNQILGIMLLGKLPIEEVLFFIIVPLMTVLTYLALTKLTGWGKAKEEIK